MRLILFLLLSSFLRAAEIRAICGDTETIRETLSQKGATYLGEYAFTDWIYRPPIDIDLNREFVRIRLYEKTGWPQKAIVVTHKIRDLRRESSVLVQTECDCIEEAFEKIPYFFVRELFFFRTGWEYSLENMNIYVEAIEEMPPSIEVIAPTQGEIFELFHDLKVTEILSDSVPAWVLHQRMMTGRHTGDQIKCELK